MTIELPREVVDALERVSGSPSSRVSLHLVEREASELGRRLADAARQAAEATGGLLPVSSRPPSPGEPAPALIIRAGERDVVRYQAVPDGPEAQPFADALLACAGVGGGVGDPILAPLGPTELTVFIAATCPNCPSAVRAAAHLAAAVPAVTATIVDVAEFPERAGRVGVRSVPTIVADGELTLVGATTGPELAERLAASVGPGGDAARFASLVDAGRFDAAGELLATGRAGDELLRRWRAGGMGGRIGLMMAAESALAHAVAALDALVPGLVELLDGADPSLQGDTADLLGRIGSPAATPALESLAADPDEDVAEAAAEALESIGRRGREAVGQ